MPEISTSKNREDLTYVVPMLANLIDLTKELRKFNQMDEEKLDPVNNLSHEAKWHQLLNAFVALLRKIDYLTADGEDFEYRINLICSRLNNLLLIYFVSEAEKIVRPAGYSFLSSARLAMVMEKINRRLCLTKKGE